MNLQKLLTLGALTGLALACGYALAQLKRYQHLPAPADLLAQGSSLLRPPTARSPHPYYLAPGVN
jgi:hypothetical protein